MVLNILDPKIFPVAISVEPFKLEIILTTNSGDDVPRATIVKPITKFETLNFLATEDAPSTNKPAPLITKMKPMRSNDIVKNILLNMNNY